MSNLVDHARVELEKVETDPWFIEGMLKTIQAFADMGHSGGSASIAIPMLNDLLQFKNLSPLTDDPDEWIDQTAMTATPGVTLWQNKRNSEAFSYDGGKSYYLLSETEGLEFTAFVYHYSEETGKRHQSWDHPLEDHQHHVAVKPSSLGNIVDSPGHD